MEAEAAGAFASVWAQFGDTWEKTTWGQKWWPKEETGYVLTQAIKRYLPEYMREAVTLMKEMGLSAKPYKTNGLEGKQLKRYVYETTVQEFIMRPHLEKQQSKTHLSAYLLQEKVAHSAFSEKRIPFSLWELRWRAFHQVLRVGAANPWLQEDQKRCKRPNCSGSGPSRSVCAPI